jgi:hypothetical protein
MLTTTQQQLVNTDVWKQERNNNLADACLQVYNCLTAQGGSKDVDPSRQIITTCTSYVNQIYEQAQGLANAHAQIKQNTNGIQRYENGTLDDSSFDLLVDIQAIGDILFANNKQVPELLFYQTPSRDNIPEIENNDGTATTEPPTTGDITPDNNPD